MSIPRHHRQLVVWQRAMDLVTETYAIVKRLPDVERYRLANQLRRAAVSIPANIAEGYGRVHRGDYVHHLSIARGSTAELETLLELTARLGYVGAAELTPTQELVDHVARLLARLILKLRRDTGSG